MEKQYNQRKFDIIGTIKVLLNGRLRRFSMHNA